MLLKGGMWAERQTGKPKGVESKIQVVQQHRCVVPVKITSAVQRAEGRLVRMIQVTMRRV